MKYAFITDANVAAFYPLPYSFVVPAGEKSKSLQTVGYLATELIKKGYSRDTTLVGIGGGMITDLVGFLATIFCRGVPFILIPTTLLAMVDASIGGKTGVNLEEGKNLLGTTTFPEKVILHLPYLETLPDAEWENGIVEILKVGLVADRDLFYRFSELGLTTVIDKAIEAKRRLVALDPDDRGCRAFLNLGHTLGHALEVLSRYRLCHGKAVAAGIVLEARLSHAMGVLALEDLQVIERTFPPLHISFTPEQILAKLGADKKTRGGIPHFVLLESVGVPYVKKGACVHPVPQAVLTQVLYETLMCPC